MKKGRLHVYRTDFDYPAKNISTYIFEFDDFLKQILYMIKAGYLEMLERTRL